MVEMVEIVGDGRIWENMGEYGGECGRGTVEEEGGRRRGRGRRSGGGFLGGVFWGGFFGGVISGLCTVGGLYGWMDGQGHTYYRCFLTIALFCLSANVQIST